MFPLFSGCNVASKAAAHEILEKYINQDHSYFVLPAQASWQYRIRNFLAYKGQGGRLQSHPIVTSDHRVDNVQFDILDTEIPHCDYLSPTQFSDWNDLCIEMRTQVPSSVLFPTVIAQRQM